MAMVVPPERNILGVMLLGVLAAACSGDRSSRPAVEHLPMESTRPLPFSGAVRAGSILYLSGQLGTDSSTRLVAGGIGPETRQTMENIRAVLSRAGATMEDLVKCTVMLADMSEWGQMNVEYVKYFPAQLPARSAFGASGLALGARVEIECVAHVR
jgi:2-iminobutanoate/2-iminopropanoate deaminase